MTSRIGKEFLLLVLVLAFVPTAMAYRGGGRGGGGGGGSVRGGGRRRDAT